LHRLADHRPTVHMWWRSQHRNCAWHRLLVQTWRMNSNTCGRDHIHFHSLHVNYKQNTMTWEPALQLNKIKVPKTNRSSVSSSATSQWQLSHKQTVLLVKLTVPQLVQKLPTLHETQTFIG
jgi:hypothetical protein